VPTEVQLTDAPAGTDTVPVFGVAVTLVAPTGAVLDPSFTFDASHPAPTTDANGLATFADCGSNPQVGGPYQVLAAGQTALGANIPSDTSNAFTVYTKLKDCSGSGGNCTDTETGGGGTQLNVSTSAVDALGTSFFDALDTSHYPTFTCDGVKKVDGRPDVLQASSDGDKTIVITWSKQVTLKFTDNGTPHWQVCMEAPKPFYNDALVFINTTNAAGFYVGTIPLCGAAGLPANNPCMAVSRNAAQEIATITIPSSWAGDPLFH